METTALLLDLFGRVDEHVHTALDGLRADDLVAAVEPGTNSVAWLVWHLTRVQDSHIAELLDEPQLWATGDWAAKVGIDPDPSNTGYGHAPEDVAAIRPENAEVLVGYHEAVAARTRSFLEGLTDTDLDRIVDENWDPPVTMGVRLISIADDDIQHGGQAAFARGILDRRRS